MTDDENFIDSVTEAEEELPPPEEENEAREVNVGNIIGLIVIGLLVIFLIAFIAVSASGKKKKKQEATELVKAGTKTVIEFKDKTPVDFYSSNIEEDNPVVEKSEKEMNEVFDNLPAEFQLPIQGETGKAPHLEDWKQRKEGSLHLKSESCLGTFQACNSHETRLDALTSVISDKFASETTKEGVTVGSLLPTDILATNLWAP